LDEPLDKLCPRCNQQLSWRKQFRKYKLLTVPSRWYSLGSNLCREKTITKAYRTICDKCAVERGLCAKCAKVPSSEEKVEEKETEVAEEEEKGNLEEEKTS